jgi:glycosyltransferase involved in cell wall biosynthesis
MEALTTRADKAYVMPPLFRRDRPLLMAGTGATVAKVRWLHSVIRRERVAVVRLNNSPAGHRPALLAAALAGVPCVAWLRSLPIRPPSLERRWRRLVRRYVAMSEAIRGAYVKGGLPRNCVDMLYDGTPVPPHPPLEPAGPFRVGSLGRLVSWKGLVDLVNAAALVLASHPETRFEIMGSEDPAQPGFKAELAAEIKRLGVQSRVVLREFHPDAAGFLRSVHCIVNPSCPAEPFGMSIIEAMAMARPVIATDGGGPAEIIEHGKTGLLVPPRRPDALAAALLSMIREPWKTRAMGVAAHLAAAERFELHRLVVQQELLFHSLVPLESSDLIASLSLTGTP